MVVAPVCPAAAQIDVSGERAGTFYEDLPHRGGMQLGDYTGLPLNEAGWRKAESWDEAVVATHGRQCNPPPRTGTLKVVTTNLRGGYLRKNGVPYSEDTTVTEYVDRFSAHGNEWLTVLTAVDDPKYLTRQFLTSTHFKREADGSKWDPRPCE